MKEIGGYFELELSRINNFPQKDGIMVNSGRNALEYVLRSIGYIKKLYIPFYTCDVVLEPIKKLQIQYSYYHVNERLEIAENICLNDDEYLLYTNYFGIKDSYVKSIAHQFRDQLIVDNAQALYAEHLEDVKTIYSPRKFVGLPDGGVVFSDSKFDMSLSPIDISYDRCTHLFKRIDLGPSSAYWDFKDNSHKLVDEPIKRMSCLTSRLIDNVDFDKVRSIRRENFSILHKVLCKTNKLFIPSTDSFECPMVYPYWAEDDSLRAKLIDHKIFVATYWPNVLSWVDNVSLEYSLVKNIIPIPIDQRYGIEDMNRIINTILYE